MAAKEKYRLLLNLSLLGLSIFVTSFEVALSKEKSLKGFGNPNKYLLSLEDLVDNSRFKVLDQSRLEKEKVALTLKVLADKQYDYDQNLYIAEGNVKTTINGGILRSDSLSYNKSSGFLSAEGNIRFIKGKQYFRGSEFRYNLIRKEGIIKNAYGILDVRNVIDDLNIDYSYKNLIESDTSDSKLKKQRNINYNDGIQYSFGNINVAGNKITRSNKSIGSINNWRFKSDLITIHKNGWKSDKIYFTNDPFDPNQIAFEGIKVIAEEDNDQLVITSSKTNLILDGRTKIFLGKRRFIGNRKKKNKFELMLDDKDRDGLVLIRRGESLRLNNNIKLDLQPQFLINRAILGKTNSYKNNHNNDSSKIQFSDLFGLNIKSTANYKDWNFKTVNDLSTLNISRIFSGLRHSSLFKRSIKAPYLNDLILNIFTTYRFRAWNGTIGETEIKSAFGGFIEKEKNFNFGEINNRYNFRIGTAKYEAEKLVNHEIISLWRSSIFSSIDSSYPIWKRNIKNRDIKNTFLSPTVILPELVFRTNIHSAYFKYEDGSDQAFLKVSAGPEIRLGYLEKNFFDYTKLSLMPGLKVKSGNSPFKFDNAIDLRTINLSLLQQIYGPLMLDIDSNLNIEENSDKYGEYYDTKIGLLWHKRAYEFGVYYHPSNNAGGLYFRLNGFEFNDSVKAVF